MSSVKDLHSSFWMEEDEWDDDFLVDNSHQERKGGLNYSELIKLSARRRAIANFVNILTGQDIPVQFSSRGGENYTDGKVVVISADAKNETFDSDVGLALHEASHILLSEFDVIHRLIGDTSTFDQNTHYPILREGFAPKNDAEKKLEKFLWDILKNEDIKKQLNDKGQIKFQRQMLLFTKDMWNWVEDRRIDHYVFTNAMAIVSIICLFMQSIFAQKKWQRLCKVMNIVKKILIVIQCVLLIFLVKNVTWMR